MIGAQNREALLLVWKQPQTRQRYLIGRLWRDSCQFHFRYDRSVPRSLDAAIEAGFRPFEAFRALDQEYVSAKLFPIFRRRALPASRSRDIQKVFDQQELSADQMAFELLRFAGGRLPTDTFEFLEAAERAEDIYRFRFPVAGWRYYGGESIADDLFVGDPVRLELDPANEWDPFAIRVIACNVHVGYVPAIYSWYLEDAVLRGIYRTAIEEIGEPEDPQRRLRVQVSVEVAGTQQSPIYRLTPSGLEQYADMLLD